MSTGRVSRSTVGNRACTSACCSCLARTTDHVADVDRTHGHGQNLHRCSLSQRTNRCATRSVRAIRRAFSSTPPPRAFAYRIFSGHIRTLAEQLDPNHQKLRIQKVCQRECPWPSAQAELRLINAYKVAALRARSRCFHAASPCFSLDPT